MNGTITAEQAKAALKQYGSERKAAEALGTTRYMLKRIAAGSVSDHSVSKAEESAKPVSLRGFAVGATTRVASKRPVATLRSRLYELKRGMAFLAADVAREWAVSPETLRKHAQDAECFRYVEVSPEKWEPCVMHPDTAKLYPVK